MAKLTKKDKKFLERVKKLDYKKGGSFVLSKKGNIYHGVPFEMLNWVHGEQNAIGSMVTEEGEKAKFKNILIVGEPKNIVPPCGMCRAAIYFYGIKNVSVLCSTKDLKKVKKFTISELYPVPYREKRKVCSCKLGRA